MFGLLFYFGCIFGGDWIVDNVNFFRNVVVMFVDCIVNVCLCDCVVFVEVVVVLI